jgi:hypothetical protein
MAIDIPPTDPFDWALLWLPPIDVPPGPYGQTRETCVPAQSATRRNIL